MKKGLSLVLAAALALSLAACGGASSSGSAAGDAPAASSPASSGVDALDSLGDVEVDENIFDVAVTLPADLVGETTQEELERKTAGQNIHSITLNDDGSATFMMSKSQHKAYMREMADSINESLAEMVGSETYPNITAIKANADFTQFTVTTKSTELSLEESFSVMGFYLQGGMYAIFNGTKGDVNIHVDFVNADTGEILASTDSSDMGAE